jgi:hypothetical protein
MKWNEVPLLKRCTARTATREPGVLLTLIAAIFAVSGGCNLFRFASQLGGKPDVPAEYTLINRPTLVLVKDPPDPMGYSGSSDMIAAHVEQELTARQLVPCVPSSKASDLRSSRPAGFTAMSPAQVGSTLGAAQVICIEILQCQVQREGATDMLKGEASASVAVIDVASGRIIWPADAYSGQMVTHQTAVLRLGDRNTLSSIQRNLDAGLAEKIARLFYKYSPDN